jgi:hypothetical protein
LCWLPAHALASHTEESNLTDDNQLIYATPDHMAQTLRQLKDLGVDRVKVSVVWSLVVPDPKSDRAPTFDATNPAAYPYGAWRRWDQLVAWARLLGLKVYFQIVPPAPQWATSGPANEGRGNGYRWSENPNPREFRQFVEAVGRRYSGSFPPEDEASLIPPPSLGVPGQTGITPTLSEPNPPVQRVDYWGVWNEPNESSWLSPWFRKVNGHQVDNSPRLYRSLVDGGYAGLAASGHAHDTILIGELASHGKVYPIPFTRELYCLSSSYRPLTGSRATKLGCPSSGNRSKFVAAHPGLFAFPGFAHHPYSFGVPPTKITDPNEITLGNLRHLETALDRERDTYHRHVRGGVGMYLTEWGYKTNPPNPYVRTSPNEQATFLNQGEYMTYLDPRITCLNQFLFVDNAPNTSWPTGSQAYWSTFQTGLIFSGGKLKPSFPAFRIPIWLPRAHHGSRVVLWGQLRPGDHSHVQTAALDFQRRGSSTWKAIRTIETGNREGFLLAHVNIPAAGKVKLAWPAPGGQTYYSRVVSVS